MKLDKFINRPVLSTVISILIVILGAIGLATLPITQYPDIAPPTVSVRATYTGASASTVLNSVIAPLEEQDQRCRKHDVHDFQQHPIPVPVISRSTSNKELIRIWLPLTYRTVFPWHKVFYLPKLPELV